MPSYGTEGGLPICPVTVQRAANMLGYGTAANMPSYSVQGTAVYMSIYGTHGRQPICSDMREVIDRLSYSGGGGTDMTW